MREETKHNLQQLVIDLHYRAGKTGDLELRKLADSLNEIIKKELKNKNATHRLLMGSLSG